MIKTWWFRESNATQDLGVNKASRAFALRSSLCVPEAQLPLLILTYFQLNISRLHFDEFFFVQLIIYAIVS
jgi:hypothetical protein